MIRGKDRSGGKDDHLPRRSFLTGGLAALVTSVFSLRARGAEFSPARVRIAYLDVPAPGDRFLDARLRRLSHGWRQKDVVSVGNDLMAQFFSALPAPDAVIFGNSGVLTDPSRLEGEWRGLGAELDFFRGLRQFPLEINGVHFLNRAALLDPRIARRLCQENHPAVLVISAGEVPLSARAEARPEYFRELLDSFPQVSLVLMGGTETNAAQVIGDHDACLLSTASPLVFPCGGRLIDLEAGPGGGVTIASKFLQTRRLDLVEESYARGEAGELRRLGLRRDRSFTVVGGKITRQGALLDPNLAPWWSDQSRVNLACVSDLHLGLDRFLPERSERAREFTGQYGERESIALVDDIFDQIASGRHRVEFYDQVFRDDPAADRHYLELPIDGLILGGDYIEHGRRAEAEVFRDRLRLLPESLLRRTIMVPGNHDLYMEDFVPSGVTSDRHRFADFYARYLPHRGETNYVVHLNDWLTVIALDTVIPEHFGMGMLQERIDWLEDMLEQLRDRVVLVVSHHPVFVYSLLAGPMESLSRSNWNRIPQYAAVNDQLIAMLGRYPNVKLSVSGHLHNVLVDCYRKDVPGGLRADDPYTIRLQMPSTIDYPCGYRLLHLTRQGNDVKIRYRTAYTRRADLREKSRLVPMFKLLGAPVEVPADYTGILEQIKREDNPIGPAARLKFQDFVDLDIRGLTDGTARDGRGYGGKTNINGKIEVSLRPGA